MFEFTNLSSQDRKIHLAIQARNRGPGRKPLKFSFAPPPQKIEMVDRLVIDKYIAP